MGRLRSAQQTLLGGGRQDLVEFAVSLQGRVDDLHRAVDEVAAGLSRVDRRVDGAVTNTSVVRYDAYEEASGAQSAGGCGSTTDLRDRILAAGGGTVPEVDLVTCP